MMSNEATHLLPRSFVTQVTYSSSQGHLTEWRHPPPSRRSHNSKSLPHLLPRQAFSFQGLSAMSDTAALS
ncbi:hypothetical protein D3C72_290170 [compost metagenome]